MTIDCDVLIIGSGAAGSVLAATLAEQTDLRIVLVERGGHFGREAMTQREWQMVQRLYAGGGTRTTDDGAIAVRGGECVGGGTTVNVALCLDPVPSVWESWRRARGLDGFSFDRTASDHGVPGLNMADCLGEVRARLNVHEPSDDEVNENNRLFAGGCRASGIGVRKFELNMRDCTGCGYCFAGCSTDAKQGTMVTYLRDAVARGVTLVHHCAIDAIDFAGDGDARRAVGARGRVLPTREGSRQNALPEGPVRFRARLVIVSAGAIESPALLQRSGHPDPHDTIGRGLVLHPSLGIIGVFDHDVAAHTGIEGTMYSDHFVAAHGFYLQCLFAPLGAGAATLPGFGVEHFELMRNARRLGTFGAMLLDSVTAENRVVWDRAAGRARIFYRLSAGDRDRLALAAEKAVQVMFAAGAREVLLPSEEPLPPLDTPWFTDRSQAALCRQLRFDSATVLGSSHCQGTAKMGADPATSVVDARCESHQVRNLIVCDSSSFPASCGANPMLSILTLARYQGRRLVAERARYGL
ncbi:MAG TPA: GMC family oxidoreductase [Polyangia bacterium]|nr:GMC family oxidoreductase [Polyangia bacterium]